MFKLRRKYKTFVKNTQNKIVFFRSFSHTGFHRKTIHPIAVRHIVLLRQDVWVYWITNTAKYMQNLDINPLYYNYKSNLLWQNSLNQLA